MNKANYLNIKKKYPLTTEGLDFIQNQILLVQELSRAHGDCYILREPTTAKSGACVIGGELFELRLGSGTGSSNIAIHEAQKTITANGEIYEEARTERYAIYTNDENDIPKSDFGFDSHVPKGSIVMWHSINGGVPKGWHYCDGNNGEEINGVKIPDLRGRFVVGRYWDDIDFRYDGNTGGEKEVKLTVEQMPEHSHNVAIAVNKNGGVGDIRTEDDKDLAYNTNEHKLGNFDKKISSSGSGEAHENLPPYYVLSFIIKCF